MEKPEIKVDETPIGNRGVNFMIYPIQDLHTEEDVTALKAELNRLREVITINTTWLWDKKAVQKWKEETCQS